ncbi:testis-expressed protein 10 homolog [Drosophila guanche]|uniref:Blast:Testis-expressed sequence 10 protein homolog n=1 Tax=Drosophila guanche TaxID=7266 RepID=A0A3B0K3U1_DROGU|nr:testis-expressed protein 10 homolog [Drosophila guanche]SPP88897.1 blast:Testis-expressed sequence 10 protein homolog [Drosophila guanche]
MGGHHKKNLRAEKAKVKLKGAKLPKGLNVTKTDFKVRKIEIREQLKETSYTESGQRQLNLKETLSRLKHHSFKFRTDAMRNVRESVKSGQADHLIGHLNELFQGIAAGALDMEHSVRQESFKTLDVLLEVLHPQAVAPFFHVISTYLKCAMTHIHPTIQEDSLLMLDVLMLRVPPSLLAQRSASTIVGNFIDMISRSRHDNEKSNRSLTMNLGHGKQTTVKWRTKVLLRLQQILATLAQHSAKTASTKYPVHVVHFDENRANYYGLLSPYAQDTRDLYAILHEPKLSAEGAQLQTYVEQLMPLLHDSWLEVRPQQQQPLLPPDASASLYVVVNLISQLWTLINQHEAANSTNELSLWLRQNHSKKFLKNFLEQDGSRFPYQQMPHTQAKGKKLAKEKGPADGGEQCLPQNMAIVQIACQFYPDPSEKQATVFAHLVQYVNETLKQLEKLTPEHQLPLVAALRSLLLDNSLALHNLIPEQLTSLLDASMLAYVEQRYATREGVSTKMLSLLCEIVQQTELYKRFGGEERFALFLGYLPELLLKPTVAEGTLRAMATLCRQMNAIFMSALVQSSADILLHLSQLQVTGNAQGEDKFENQKRILNLFYYARTCDTKNQLKKALRQLAKQQKNDKDEDDSPSNEQIFRYLQSVLAFD